MDTASVITVVLSAIGLFFAAIAATAAVEAVRLTIDERTRAADVALIEGLLAAAAAIDAVFEDRRISGRPEGTSIEPETVSRLRRAQELLERHGTLFPGLSGPVVYTWFKLRELEPTQLPGEKDLEDLRREARAQAHELGTSKATRPRTPLLLRPFV